MDRNKGHTDGELAEFAVAADLVRKDCRISYTYGQYKYDLVADKDDQLLRIQVKKANKMSETPWKYRIFTDRYQEGQVDIFAGYIVDQDQVFYATFDDCGSKEFRINTKCSEELNEANAKRANLLEKYTFERATDSVMHDDRDREQRSPPTQSHRSENE